MKPNFKEVFWTIDTEMFKPKLSKTWLDKQTEKELDYITYRKVIPVYVKCISEMYDGTTEFCITPVDVRDGITKDWRWSRSIKDGELGKSVFKTKAQAVNSFNKKYSKEERDLFDEKEKFQRLQS